VEHGETQVDLLSYRSNLFIVYILLNAFIYKSLKLFETKISKSQKNFLSVVLRNLNNYFNENKRKFISEDISEQYFVIKQFDL